MDTDKGKLKYLERETCPSVILSTTNLLRTILGSNPGLHSE